MQRGNCNVILFNVQKIKYLLPESEGEKQKKSFSTAEMAWH